MKFSILHILVVVSISGVLCDNSDNGIIVNGKNKTDVPTASTVLANNVTTPIPTTINPNVTTAIPSTTTTVSPNSSTTVSTTSTTVTTPVTTIAPNTSTTSTTLIPNVTTTTESTTSVPTSAPSHKGRRFDGPSFIGGIILASGLMAICFVSWKFYKARTERNYHTL